MPVAIRAITRLQDADDINVSLGAPVDEYALCWDNDTAKFVLRAVAGGGVTDHGALTGLADDDHAGYALLAGRAGGTTLYGGNAANDDITIHGTSHATRTTSYVLLQPTAGYVGIGTTSPLTALHIVGALTVFGGIRPSLDSTTALQLQNVAGTSILNIDTTNGRIGIKTTSPQEILQVGDATENATNRKALKFGVGGYDLPGVFATNSNGDKIIFYTGADFDGRFGVSSLGDVWLKSLSTQVSLGQSYGSLNFYTGQGAGAVPVNRLSISGTGNVGIGGSITSASTLAGASMVISAGKVGIGTISPATRLDIDTGALTMKEMTAPTGVADKAMLYTKDNGAGKTQLCVKLGDDVEIVLATQA